MGEAGAGVGHPSSEGSSQLGVGAVVTASIWPFDQQVVLSICLPGGGGRLGGMQQNKKCLPWGVPK